MLKLQKYGWIVTVSVLLGGFLSACDDLSNQIGSDKKVQNDAEIRAYLAENNIDALSTIEGLYYKVVKKGSGRKAELNDEIKVSYIARRLDGVVVNSSEINSNTPARAIYSQSQLPYFSDEGMALLFGTPLLTEGDSAIVLLPSHLGQGAAGTLLFPAFSPLRIDLKVLSIKSEKDYMDAFAREQNVVVTETAENGLRFGKVLTRSDSVQVKSGDKIQIKNTGRRMDNSIFDSGTIAVTLGTTKVVQGFSEGLLKMRVGEKAHLLFPSKLGYGATGTSGIAPYSPLFFEAEIVSKTK